MSLRDRLLADDVVSNQNGVFDPLLMETLRWWHATWDLERAADKLIAVMSIEIGG